MRIRRFVLHARRAFRSVCDESIPSRTSRTGRVKRPAAARRGGRVLYGARRPLRLKASALRRFFSAVFIAGGETTVCVLLMAHGIPPAHNAIKNTDLAPEIWHICTRMFAANWNNCPLTCDIYLNIMES